MPSVEARIDSVKGSAFQVPTDRPESDGTLAWSSTTLVLAEVTAAGEEGIGYTYAHPAAGSLIATTLEVIVTETPAHLRRRVDKETGLPLIAF